MDQRSQRTRKPAQGSGRATRGVTTTTSNGVLAETSGSPPTSVRSRNPTASTFVAVPIGVAIPPTLDPIATASSSAVANRDRANPAAGPASSTRTIPTTTGHSIAAVAVLLTHIDTNVAAAVVNTFADGRVEMLPLQSIDVPAGKALEIWTLWDRAVGPRSVGLIDRARSTPLRLDNLPLGRDQLFEITLEPASGSPTGRPTGPIIAKGTTSQRL